MSFLVGDDENQGQGGCEAVDLKIIPRTNDIGGFEVGRALPFRSRRMVGPFIFWDQMGPGEFLTGNGVDVRPHPHIGLSTVTYLFEGTLDHKDSLGFDVRIKPGEINLMSAGAGIVHSERTGADVRQSPSRLFGIQSWLAQPKDKESGDNAFNHYAEQDIPFIQESGVRFKVIMGGYEGVVSPVRQDWDTAYFEVFLDRGKQFNIPKTIEERAIFTVRGTVEICGVRYDAGHMLVLHPHDNVIVSALDDCHFMVLGGATMDGPRHIWWNFVSSDKDAISQAAQDWREGKFAKVPEDDEFIPLPDDRPPYVGLK